MSQFFLSWNRPELIEGMETERSHLFGLNLKHCWNRPELIEGMETRIIFVGGAVSGPLE